MTAKPSPDWSRRIVLYLKAEGWRPPPGHPAPEEEAELFFATVISDAREEVRKGFLEKPKEK